ncbi:MAG: phosphatidylserine/phosphatidylglycerophosphate/cardiolipin synthase family protein [Bacteroidota bacterium]|nr:phosphatidylserine/phosphatidylglycerophosphate/cardiolipin synthase family protein [Bacteroidota bacterium]MDX5430297.1 phosphatidylserine/phosphatidylglycerophosphate/cardiolipin synthase family protein [Bacteroidota bacterium]MDX5469058.1 phosphatidylserine/phosphatidylglycerophosphate/cardiolipin synthase family protein [Bacteroidota bacterium]
MSLEGEYRIPGNGVSVFQGGPDYFNTLFDRIRGARIFIHIQMYILADDTTGNRLLEELFSAAQRGVKVFLLLDAFGSSWVRNAHLKSWKAKGLQVKLFSRRLRLKRLVLGRRLHVKLMVIDNHWLSIGGLNMADRYSGFDGQTPWLDMASWIRGPAVKYANTEAAVYWPRKVQRYLKSQAGAPIVAENIALSVYFNDWRRRRFHIRQAYHEAIRAAKSEIFIVAAYFFPSRKLLRLLLEKAKEGIHIKLLFSSVSDVPLVKPATEYYYQKLQAAGIEILEWQGSILHAKFACIDREWITLGSYNLNQLSDYGSLETNIAFSSKEIAQALLEELQGSVLSYSQSVNALPASLFARFKRYFSYLALRLALRIMFLTNRPASDV